MAVEQTELTFDLAPEEEFPVPAELTVDEAVTLRALRARHGRASAVCVDDLAAAVDLDGRRVQQIVKHLVELHQAPIGTATTEPFGYYWIETDAERREVRDGLVRRALSTLKRARAYDRSGWVARLIGQAELNLTSTTMER